MKNCPNCNAELKDMDLFCGECGAEIPAEASVEVSAEAPETQETLEPTFCSQCGQQVEPDTLFCPKCGASVSQDAMEAEAAPAPKKKNGKALLIGGIALVAVAAIVVTVFLLFFGRSNTKYIAYIKDGEVWFSYFSQKPMEITTKLLDTDTVSESQLANLDGQDMGIMYGQVSADGNTIFFPDKISDNGMNLYYRDLSDPDSEAVKISADVTAYFINDKGDRIFYMKNDSFYIGPVDQPRKVASEIDSVIAVDAKFQTVVYRESEKIEQEDEIRYEYTYYLWKDGEKEKLVSGEIKSFAVMNKPADCRLNQLLDGAGMQAGPVRYIYQSLTKFCYVKDDVLSVYELNGETEKIDSQVSAIAAAYPTGEIFYLKNEDAIKYVDYIQNADKMELSEDYQRRELATPNTLWLSHDGSKEQIAENITYSSFAPEKPIAVLRSYDYDSIKKVEMTEDMSFYVACSLIDEKKAETKTVYIVTDGVACEAQMDDVYNCIMTKDGSSIYFLCVEKENEKDENGVETGRKVNKEEGDIYLIAVEKGSIKAPELYDSDVTSGALSLSKKEELIYYKDYNKEKNRATLYVAQNEIDSDVQPGSVKVLENGGYVYYIDYNSDEKKKCGTLRLFQKGEATTIADDVHTFVVTPDSEILYLQDYNTEKNKGDLYRYNKGENEKIDEDVTALLDIYLYDKVIRTGIYP